jgi:hypothetical protein
MQEQYNKLFKLSLDDKLSDSERVHKLEQMKGVAWAMNLTDALINTMQGELEYEENLEEITEMDD